MSKSNHAEDDDAHAVVGGDMLGSTGIQTFLFLFFIFFGFLGLHLRHVEVSSPGVELQLQPLAYARATATPEPSCVCDLHHSSWRCWILNPLSEARDRTFDIRLLVGFIIVTAEPQWDLHAHKCLGLFLDA